MGIIVPLKKTTVGTVVCRKTNPSFPKKQTNNELRYHQIVGIQDIDPLRQEKTHQNPANYASKKAPEPLFWILPSLLGSHIIVAEFHPSPSFGRGIYVQPAPLVSKKRVWTRTYQKKKILKF